MYDQDVIVRRVLNVAKTTERSKSRPWIEQLTPLDPSVGPGVAVDFDAALAHYGDAAHDLPASWGNRFMGMVLLVAGQKLLPESHARLSPFRDWLFDGAPGLDAGDLPMLPPVANLRYRTARRQMLVALQRGDLLLKLASAFREQYPSQLMPAKHVRMYDARRRQPGPTIYFRQDAFKYLPEEDVPATCDSSLIRCDVRVLSDEAERAAMVRAERRGCVVHGAHTFIYLNKYVRGLWNLGEATSAIPLSNWADSEYPDASVLSYAAASVESWLNAHYQIESKASAEFLAGAMELPIRADLRVVNLEPQLKAQSLQEQVRPRERQIAHVAAPPSFESGGIFAGDAVSVLLRKGVAYVLSAALVPAVQSICAKARVPKSISADDVAYQVDHVAHAITDYAPAGASWLIGNLSNEQVARLVKKASYVRKVHREGVGAPGFTMDEDKLILQKWRRHYRVKEAKEITRLMGRHTPSAVVQRGQYLLTAVRARGMTLDEARNPEVALSKLDQWEKRQYEAVVRMTVVHAHATTD